MVFVKVKGRQEIGVCQVGLAGAQFIREAL